MTRKRRRLMTHIRTLVDKTTGDHCIELAKKGASYNDIAKSLNSRGFANPWNRPFDNKDVSNICLAFGYSKHKEVVATVTHKKTRQNRTFSLEDLTLLGDVLTSDIPLKSKEMVVRMMVTR